MLRKTILTAAMAASAAMIAMPSLASAQRYHDGYYNDRRYNDEQYYFRPISNWQLRHMSYEDRQAYYRAREENARQHIYAYRRAMADRYNDRDFRGY